MSSLPIKTDGKILSTLLAKKVNITACYTSWLCCIDLVFCIRRQGVWPTASRTVHAARRAPSSGVATTTPAGRRTTRRHRRRTARPTATTSLPRRGPCHRGHTLPPARGVGRSTYVVHSRNNSRRRLRRRRRPRRRRRRRRRTASRTATRWGGRSGRRRVTARWRRRASGGRATGAEEAEGAAGPAPPCRPTTSAWRRRGTRAGGRCTTTRTVPRRSRAGGQRRATATATRRRPPPRQPSPSAVEAGCASWRPAPRPCWPTEGQTPCRTSCFTRWLRSPSDSHSHRSYM